jgi:hypothetical protein
VDLTVPRKVPFRAANVINWEKPSLATPLYGFSELFESLTMLRSVDPWEDLHFTCLYLAQIPLCQRLFKTSFALDGRHFATNPLSAIRHR